MSSLELTRPSLVLADDPPGVVRRTARWKRYELPPVDHAWLDRAKLVEIGFRIDLEPADPEASEHYSRAMPRRVFLVVEQDGRAWRAWLARRRRFADRPHHAVVAGLIRPRVVPVETGPPALTGDVLGPVVSRVTVARRLRGPLEAFLPGETWEAVEAREREQARHGWPSPASPRSIARRPR